MKLDWRYEDETVVVLGADLFQEPDNWIFREDTDDTADTIEFAEQQLADHIRKHSKIAVDVQIHDNGVYGHRTEITPKSEHKLNKLYHWCVDNIDDDTYHDIVIHPCITYICENCYKEVDEPDTREEILEAGYVLNDYYDLVPLAVATPEERGAHIAKTTDPVAMGRKYLLKSLG